MPPAMHTSTTHAPYHACPLPCMPLDTHAPSATHRFPQMVPAMDIYCHARPLPCIPPPYMPLPHMSPVMHTPCHACLRMHDPPTKYAHCHAYLLADRMTDTCQNITFLTLPVKILKLSKIESRGIPGRVQKFSSLLTIIDKMV